VPVAVEVRLALGPGSLSRDYFRCAELHGLKGYDAWAEHIAKTLAAARQAPEPDLTDADAETIGKIVRHANNAVVGDFAAGLSAKVYCLNKSEVDNVLTRYTDAELGREFISHHAMLGEYFGSPSRFLRFIRSRRGDHRANVFCGAFASVPARLLLGQGRP
jgi:hypothetical protein